ncbi:uncharacterized protein G2W53_001101 [Senna tora]|uniref:Uncharacterized protein n=1 Tax=Senna tora TaxID=362788 RepID=A0A835CIB3_9FABA|nr:uncharacterized protein G2W53_001101 [Senna tora]
MGGGGPSGGMRAKSSGSRSPLASRE